MMAHIIHYKILHYIKNEDNLLLQHGCGLPKSIELAYPFASFFHPIF